MFPNISHTEALSTIHSWLEETRGGLHKTGESGDVAIAQELENAVQEEGSWLRAKLSVMRGKYLAEALLRLKAEDDAAFRHALSLIEGKF